METLVQLALIWTAVFVAVIAAGKTRLTPVLYYLAPGCIMVNVGLMPAAYRWPHRGPGIVPVMQPQPIGAAIVVVGKARHDQSREPLLAAQVVGELDQGCVE